MKSMNVDRRVRRAAVVELMESRQLLSATLTSQVPTQSVATGQSTMVNLSSFFNDPTVPGTAVLMQTPLGNIPIALATSTPLTDANFISYINAGEYADTIVHRSVPGFVIQGGGYTPDGNHITQFSPVQSEAGISNTVGTIAMALSTGPNSGTSEWFINLGDNSALDTGDGGPFTVFGNVIYNGMSVVNTIANESIINGDAQSATTMENGAWQTVPVVNYSGVNPSTSTIPASNLVTTDTTVVPALSYSTMVSDPSLLTASVASNGALTLTPAAGITSSTTATVTVTATDLGGGTASTTFDVDVSANGGGGPTVTPITIGASAAKSVTYTDSNGTVATVTLNGPGNATVDFTGSDVTQYTLKKATIVSGANLAISSIVTSSTTGASGLTITTKGGTGAIDVGAINTAGLKSLIGKGVTLTGNVTSSGGVGMLTVAAATGGSIAAASVGSFNVSGTFADDLDLTNSGNDLTKFTAAAISGGTWTVSGNIKSLTAGTISGWSPDITGSISSLTTKTGDLSGTITAASVGMVKIKGNLSNASITLTGAGNDLTNLSAGSQITGSSIVATGNIGNVSAAGLTGSSIDAGLSDTVQGLPSSAGDFVTVQTIKSVKLPNTADAFTDSDIDAADIGKLSLGGIQTSNGGIPMGVGSEDIKSLSLIIAGAKSNLKSLNNPSTLPAILTGLGAIGDFTIVIV